MERYFQVGIPLSADMVNWNHPDIPRGPRPRVYIRGLVSPDIIHHYCSSQKLLYVHVLDIILDWGDVEVSDDYREEWFTLTLGWEENDDYWGYHSLIREDNGWEEVVWADGILVAYQGEYMEEPDPEDDDHYECLEDAIEWAKGNHLV